MATYFRICLLVPLLLALVGFGMRTAQVYSVFEFLLMAMMFAGIPYVGFVVCALLWSFFKKNVDYNLAFIWSPVVFGVFCSIYFYFMLAPSVNDQNPLPLFFRLSPFMSLFAVIVSGFFSWGALLLWHVFKRFRLRKNE